MLKIKIIILSQSSVELYMPLCEEIEI